MSRSRSRSRRTLRVLSEDPGVQITILNQALEPVAQDVHDLEVTLEPGLYEARFEAGSSVREQLISVKPGSGPIDVRQDRIAFASAAPLSHTRDQVPEQSEAAARLSKEVHREVGPGGQLLVFVRDEDQRGRSNPARGLTLHAIDGEEVGSVESDGQSGGGAGSSHPPWSGCTYRLRPGPWRLRCRAPGIGLVEQSVVVSRKWQTQVFLQRRRLQEGGSRWPELADASVLMATADVGFQPDHSELRATELARQGLRDRRTVISAGNLYSMLFGKTKNPMLAIYAGHLLLQAGDFERQFLTRVVRKLRELVGDHPDVMALLLAIDPKADVGDFAVPPMLSSSWSIICAATAARSELVPRGSLSEAISERVLAGGPWLRWQMVSEEELRQTGEEREESLDLGTAIAGLAELTGLAEWQEAGDISLAESEVIALAAQAGWDAAKTSDTDLLERLGVPRTVAEDAISSVLERVSQDPTPR
jgi:hypothetical protein